jgi:hypothetical protein
VPGQFPDHAVSQVSAPSIAGSRRNKVETVNSSQFYITSKTRDCIFTDCGIRPLVELATQIRFYVLNGRIWLHKDSSTRLLLSDVVDCLLADLESVETASMPSSFDENLVPTWIFSSRRQYRWDSIAQSENGGLSHTRYQFEHVTKSTWPRKRTRHRLSRHAFRYLLTGR